MKYFLWSILLFYSCELPEDTAGTLHKVQGQTLEVGISQNPPWVIINDSISGIEVQLIKQFAATINAEITWTTGSESELMKKLEAQQIHMVLAGIEEKTAWEKEAGLSRPYFAKKVVACRKGESAFLMQVEAFFYQHQQQIDKLIRQYPQ